MNPIVFGHLRLMSSQHAWLRNTTAVTANNKNPIPGTIKMYRPLQATKIIAEMTTTVTVKASKN